MPLARLLALEQSAALLQAELREAQGRCGQLARRAAALVPPQPAAVHLSTYSHNHLVLHSPHAQTAVRKSPTGRVCIPELAHRLPVNTGLSDDEAEGWVALGPDGEAMATTVGGVLERAASALRRGVATGLARGKRTRRQVDAVLGALAAFAVGGRPFTMVVSEVRAAPPPIARRGGGARDPRCMVITTTALSARAAPGDPETNARYQRFIEGCDELLEEREEAGWAWDRRGEGRPPRLATDAELCELCTHTEEYLDAMRRRTSRAAPGRHVDCGTSAAVGPGTEAAARAGAAAVIDAAVAGARGELDLAMCITKPPGHHVTGNAVRCRGASPRNLPFGFCHLNGVAAAAAAVRKELGPDARVAVLDVDVHHGNGCEDTWYWDGHVLTVSLGEHLLWPGAEHHDPEAVGAGAGVGANLNFPLLPGEGDACYVYALLEHALPAIRRFNPALLIVAFGFDPLEQDPYASMNASPALFGWLAAHLRAHPVGRAAIFNLEGGYDPEAGLVATSLMLDGLSGATTAAEFLGAMGLPAEPRARDAVLRRLGGLPGARGYTSWLQGVAAKQAAAISKC